MATPGEYPSLGLKPDGAVGAFNFDADSDVVLGDFAEFETCFKDPNRPFALHHPRFTGRLQMFVVDSSPDVV